MPKWQIEVRFLRVSRVAYAMTPKALENLTVPPKTRSQPQALAPWQRDLQVGTNAIQGNKGELRARKPQFLEVQPTCKAPISR